ncbi:MAG: DNA-directed RNA polymerase subunit omega [Coriobacteriales bacterium]
MSIVEPRIDKLLEKTEEDKYLLCALSSKRSRDINDMMRGQRDRAVALQSVSEIAEFAGRKPLSLAMEEIARGEVSYDKAAFEADES